MSDELVERLLPCPFCECDDVRNDHPNRAPRVYCSRCKATAASPDLWNRKLSGPLLLPRHRIEASRPSEDEVERVAKDVIARAVKRMQEFAGAYVGRPAWEEVVAEEMRAGFIALERGDHRSSETSPTADAL